MVHSKEKKNMDRAKKDLAKKVKENPDDFESVRDLLESHYLMSDSKRDLERALSIVRDATKRFSDNPEIFRLASILYMRIEGVSNAKSLALEAAQKYRALAPESARALLYLGYIYWWTGDLNRAIEITEGAVKRSEELGEERTQSYCQANLAYFYAEAEDWEHADEALELAESAIRIQDIPNHVDTLGYVIMKFSKTLEDLNRAEELFNKALQYEGTRTVIVQEHLAELKKMKKTLAGKPRGS